MRVLTWMSDGHSYGVWWAALWPLEGLTQADMTRLGRRGSRENAKVRKISTRRSSWPRQRTPPCYYTSTPAFAYHWGFFLPGRVCETAHERGLLNFFPCGGAQEGSA